MYNQIKNSADAWPVVPSTEADILYIYSYCGSHIMIHVSPRKLVFWKAFTIVFMQLVTYYVCNLLFTFTLHCHRTLVQMLATQTRTL